MLPAPIRRQGLALALTFAAGCEPALGTPTPGTPPPAPVSGDQPSDTPPSPGAQIPAPSSIPGTTATATSATATTATATTATLIPKQVRPIEPAQRSHPSQKVPGLGDEPSFSLSTNETVFYAMAPGQLELKVTGNLPGQVSLREVGLGTDDDVILGPRPFEPKTGLALTLEVEPHPGTHAFELWWGPTTGGPSRRVASTHIDIRGPLWSRLEALAVRVGTTLEARTEKPDYEIGELLKLAVKVPRPGHVLVLGVDAEDAPVILFPNQFAPYSETNPGHLSIPRAGAHYELTAQPPRGETLLLVLWSPEPLLDLSPELYGEQNFIVPSSAQIDALEAALAPDPDTRMYPDAALALLFTRIL